MNGRVLIPVALLFAGLATWSSGATGRTEALACIPAVS